MAKRKGRSLRIKLEDSVTPGTYNAIAGAKEDSFTLNNGEIDVTDKDSSAWRQLLDGGIQSMSLSVSGLADGNVLAKAAFAAATVNLQIENEDGDVFEGAFQIRSYEGGGPNEEGETFSCTFESAGEITPTWAA